MAEPPTLSVEVCVQVTDAIAALADIPRDSEHWTQWIATWLAVAPKIPPSGTGYELALRLCDDAEIQYLNANYRDRDRPTDVLAFASLETDMPDPTALELPEASAEPLYLGDIIISVETARRQAAERHHALSLELVWLATHGLLHLLGWDHPSADALAAMLACQEIMLRNSNHWQKERALTLGHSELADYT
nr:rRNA maturation RNase YbeY [Rubidibacter lacunae]